MDLSQRKKSFFVFPNAPYPLVATWDHTQTVGWEMSACQETPCVLPPVTPPPPPSARLGRSSATWGPLLRAAGWEITVWRRALSVQLSVTLLLLHSVVLLRSGEEKQFSTPLSANDYSKLWRGNSWRVLARRLLYAGGIRVSSILQHSGSVSVPGRRNDVRLRCWRERVLVGRLLLAGGFRVCSCCLMLKIEI